MLTGNTVSYMKIEFYLQDHGRNMDYDDSKIDDDLDKLLQHIKEEQQNSLVKYFVGFFIHCKSGQPSSLPAISN
jgi:hypothetical protein